MSLSIIIPTINRYDDLLNTVNDLFAQSFKNFEILIIDQSDTNNSEIIDTLKQNSIIKYIYSDIKSASAARNIGIEKSKGAILLFLDDDVIIKDKEYLSYFISNLEDTTINGVVGPIIDVNTKTIRETRHKWSYNKNWGWLFFPRNYNKKCRINDGGAGNLCVRKASAIEIGGMDENYVKGAHREEADFNFRYTKKFGWYQFDPRCSLIHIGRKTGGVRSWNKNVKTKAQHHFDGAIYFVLKNVKLQHYPAHIFSTFFFFFYRKEILSRPDLFFITFFKLIKGFFNALYLLKKGAHYLSTNE